MSRKSDRKEAEFVFVPLGGVGEIGMNLYLYGYGPEGAREWLIAVSYTHLTLPTILLV